MKPIPQPDSSQFCPIDGTRNCGELTAARSEVEQAQREGPRAALRGWFSVSEVEDATGKVTRSRDWHIIVAAEERGLDWRAKVRSGWQLVPYKQWFSEPWPDPQLPHADPPQPRPTVDTPRVVRDWFHREVAAGRIIVQVPAAPLPSPAARRRLRETAGLSRPAAGALLGVSKTVRLWEEGRREPSGEARDRYVDLLSSWRDSAQESAQKPAQEPREPDPEDGADPEVQEMLREAAEEAGHPLTADDYIQARAAAYKRHRERMQRIYGCP